VSWEEQMPGEERGRGQYQLQSGWAITGSPNSEHSAEHLDDIS
jgi:hypothetical protein